MGMHYYHSTRMVSVIEVGGIKEKGKIVMERLSVSASEG